MSSTPEINYRWYHPIYLLFLPILMIFPTVAGFLYFAAKKVDIPTSIWVFWVCSGVVSYFLLGLFVNRSRLHLEPGRVRVKNGPLPWWPSPTLKIETEDRFGSRSTRRGTSASMHYLVLESPQGNSRRVMQAPSSEKAQEWASLLNQSL